MSKYTKEVLEPIIQHSKTWADVCRSLGITPMSGSQSYVKSQAIKLNIDSSHFLGQRSNLGRSFPKKDLSQYLVKESTITSAKLRSRLIRDGIKGKYCERCGLTEWLGEVPPLELDHINGDHFDNRLENLRIICANCHYQITNENRRSRRPTAGVITLRTLAV